jgi:threonine/homoserine efflux transporter RhtA
MNINLTLSNMEPVLALIAGILILIMPQLLSLIVAIYLIVIGVTGLTSRF